MGVVAQMGDETVLVGNLDLLKQAGGVAGEGPSLPGVGQTLVHVATQAAGQQSRRSSG